MSTRIEELKGAAAFGKKLAAAQILSTEDLLERCANSASRVVTAAETGITEKELLKWAQVADMMRIPGLTDAHAQLLHAAGIETIRSLRASSSQSLRDRLEETNRKKKLLEAVPSVGALQGWIDRAKVTEPRVA